MIASLLPPHHCYLEPFFGGGSVFWYKSPATLETINDIDEHVVHLYRVLRDPVQFAEFERLVALTPYARQEYETCRDVDVWDADPVRRAWAFFILARQGFGGSTGMGVRTGWKYSVTPAPHMSHWGYRTRNVGNSAGRRWLSVIEGLPQVHDRLQGVQIEFGDWQRVMDAYATPDTVVYLDPPYLLSTRTGDKRYRYEMTDWQAGDEHRDERDVTAHLALTEYLLTSPAQCVLSGYRRQEVHAPLEDAGWERIDIDVSVSAARHRTGLRRTESIWRNPAAGAAWAAARLQPPLFEEEEP